MSLGRRCLEWCKREMLDHPTPDLERLAEWFTPVGRGLEDMVRAGTRLNHCAAAQCAATAACIGTEEWPHGYRAGAKQLKADAVERGRWHEVSEVLSGLWTPSPGDLAVYDRSQEGRPETSWWGHVDRVIQVMGHSYANIGANEGPGGAWRVETTSFTHPKLLGFIDVADEPTPPTHLITPKEREQLLAMRDHSLAMAEASWWEEYDRERAKD